MWKLVSDVPPTRHGCLCVCVRGPPYTPRGCVNAPQGAGIGSAHEHARHDVRSRGSHVEDNLPDRVIQMNQVLHMQHLANGSFPAGSKRKNRHAEHRPG